MSLSFARPTAQQILTVYNEWGWSFGDSVKGYMKCASEFFDGLEVLQRIDDADVFFNDFEAVQQAEKDGIKILQVGKDLSFSHKKVFKNFDENFFIDTPQALLILKDYLRDDLRPSVDTSVQEKPKENNPVNTFFSKVKDLLAETAPAEQVLYAAAKALSEFSKEDKAKIGAFLSDKGADTNGNLEQVISKVLNLRQQNIQRKQKSKDMERGR